MARVPLLQSGALAVGIRVYRRVTLSLTSGGKGQIGPVLVLVYFAGFVFYANIPPWTAGRSVVVNQEPCSPLPARSADWLDA